MPAKSGEDSHAVTVARLVSHELGALGGDQVASYEDGTDVEPELGEFNKKSTQRNSPTGPMRERGGEGTPTKRALKPVSEEFVKGVLIRLAKTRAETLQRHFPEIARNDYVVTYDHIDSLTADQAEIVIHEITQLIQSFNYTERKIRNGYKGAGRPSLTDSPDEDDERDVKDISAKRKTAIKTIEDLCSVYSLENPLS